MKVLGADLIAYWKEWPGGEGVFCEEMPISERSDGKIVWMDESYEDENKAPLVDPKVKYDVTWGYLGWQGKDKDGRITRPPDGFDDDFPRVLKKWLKARTHKTMVVEIPIADEQTLRDLCKTWKWKVS